MYSPPESCNTSLTDDVRALCSCPLAGAEGSGCDLIAWPALGYSEPYTLSSQRTVSIQSALQSALKTLRKTTVSVRKKLKIPLD